MMADLFDPGLDGRLIAEATLPFKMVLEKLVPINGLKSFMVQFYLPSLVLKRLVVS
jgi:hypothetical protein